MPICRSLIALASFRIAGPVLVLPTTSNMSAFDNPPFFWQQCNRIVTIHLGPSTISSKLILQSLASPR